jgi:uroporphyrin-3 C-methyltransferase
MADKKDKPATDDEEAGGTESPADQENTASSVEIAPLIEPTPENGSDVASEAVTELEPEPGPEPQPREKTEPQSPPMLKPAAPARGGALSGLALLLALLALGLSGWLFYLTRMPAVEPDAGAEPDLRAELSARLQQAEQAAAGDRAQLEESRAELQRTLQREIQALRSSNEDQFNSLQASQNSQRQRLLEYTTTERSDWMLAEAEYLLRLANQRLIMAADTRSAIALLGSADTILRELEDSELYPVRAAIARDLAALRAVPQVDVEGTWLRLQALIGEVDQLVLFELPEAAVIEAPVAEGTWEQRLEQGFRAALANISRYVVVTRRDAPYKPMLSPQWEGMVRQNLRMLLEQARAALLSGNQLLYQQSLENTRRWLNEFFSLKESGVSALDAELADLLDVSIGQEYPDINSSLSALKTVVNTRHMVAEGQ